MTNWEISKRLEKNFFEACKIIHFLDWSMAEDREMLEAVYAFMQGWDEEEIL